MSEKKRISVGGGESLGQNPFSGLDGGAFAGGQTPAAKSEPDMPAAPQSPRRARRVDVRREKAGRGGKTVTVIAGLETLDTRSLQDLASRLRRALGVGGGVKARTIELQGDQRDAVMQLLEREGFRPVRAGG